MEEKEEEVHEAPDPDTTDDESELKMDFQDASILNKNTSLEYQLPRHQKCAYKLLNLISTVDATPAMKHMRNCLRLLFQNVMICGMKPVDQPWLMKQWSVNASCSYCDPMRPVRAPSSLQLRELCASPGNFARIPFVDFNYPFNSLQKHLLN